MNGSVIRGQWFIAGTGQLPEMIPGGAA